MKTLFFVLLINYPNQTQSIVYSEEMSAAACLIMQESVWNVSSPVAYWLNKEPVRTIDAACIPSEQVRG